MASLTAPSERNHDFALLVIRVVVGAIFIAHGYQKVFQMGIGNVTGMFAQIGIPLASVAGPLICVLELAGGIALILGAFTRVAGALLACDMLGAIIFVHGKNGFFLPKGFEFVFANFGMSLALALAGAGALSVDAMLSRRGSTLP
jgi:putative oxidoreductase